MHEAPELQAEREDWSRPVSRCWWLGLPAPVPDRQGATEDDPEAHPPSTPPLSSAPPLPAVFTLCLFLSHFFSLFFQKRKSSSSVQLMVSVCHLPNAGNAGPRPLAPASLLQAARGTRGGERVLRACLVRVPRVTLCALCMCVCCWRVSVDISTSMAQTGKQPDSRPESSAGYEGRFDPHPTPSPWLLASPALRSRTHLRARSVPGAARVGGLVWPKQWAL